MTHMLEFTDEGLSEFTRMSDLVTRLGNYYGESSVEYFTALQSFHQCGIMTGNPYMIGGGLLLSELEAQKKAEAEAERQNIENEKNRRKNIQSVLGQMSTTKFGV